ncbi:MAG TPA: copper resistance protein CopC [Dictyobacter sp.]|jgi:copper transport protein|nr:copper resistance protein CopC [Dictyobacter sp.]
MRSFFCVCCLTVRRNMRLFLFALLLTGCLLVGLPGNAEAHAILLRSTPASDAVLSSEPAQIQMWFSEDLNPTFSTAMVVNVNQQRVDQDDHHISPDDSREMSVSLKPNLAPGYYIVIWRTQSADDGHILDGSFRFGIADATGAVPGSTGDSSSAENLLGGNAVSSAGANGQMDGATFFSFLMITLVDLGVVFWVGAQLWSTFVMQANSADSQEQQDAEQVADARFLRRFSLPTLLILLFANIGVLIGQALQITGNSMIRALSPHILFGLMQNGHFGTFWTMREVVVLLASVLTCYSLFRLRTSEQRVSGLISWVNLVLGLALIMALVLSGHAAAVTSNVLAFAIWGDWLHLFAASLWVGGMLYLSLVFLPVLRGKQFHEQTQILLTILPCFSPVAIAGVVLMAVTGPFNATVHMSSFAQLVTTAYGRALTVKIVLVIAMLATSAVHVFIYRRRLAGDFARYRQVSAGMLAADNADDESSEQMPIVAGDVKMLEASVRGQTQRLQRILRWEPLLGVAVLACTGLLNVFAGTLTPVAANQSQPSQQVQVKPYNATVKTTDGAFTAKIAVSPNHFGSNMFTVTVFDKNSKQDANVGVSVYATMMDMQMGTETINLQPDGQGHFSANGDLNMSGHYQLRIQIRTPQNTMSEGTTTMYTPF